MIFKLITILDPILKRRRWSAVLIPIESYNHGKEWKRTFSMGALDPLCD